MEEDLILLRSFEKIITNQCSPKKVIKNDKGEPIALECGCGKYHPILGKSLRLGDQISNEVLSEMIDRNINYLRILAEQ